MLSPTTPSVKASLALGLDVCLPELLDFWLELTETDCIRPDVAYSIMTTDVAGSHDITMREATNVIRFSLTKMGIPFFTQIGVVV